MATIIETLMGNVSSYNSQSEYNLAAEIKGETVKEADAKTASVSKAVERVPNEELERAYRVDSFIFNAVNVAVQMIMSAGYEITAKKASVRKYFEQLKIKK